MNGSVSWDRGVDMVLQLNIMFTWRPSQRTPGRMKKPGVKNKWDSVTENIEKKKFNIRLFFPQTANSAHTHIIDWPTRASVSLSIFTLVWYYPKNRELFLCSYDREMDRVGTFLLLSRFTPLGLPAYLFKWA